LGENLGKSTTSPYGPICLMRTNNFNHHWGKLTHGSFWKPIISITSSPCMFDMSRMMFRKHRIAIPPRNTLNKHIHHHHTTPFSTVIIPAVGYWVRGWPNGPSASGYRPREELWLLRRRIVRCRTDTGAAVAALPGPPPCSWMLEASLGGWWCCTECSSGLIWP
jgi:hypothetical protein